MLAVIETHPIQYHAPVYRRLQQTFHIPVTAIYGSDFSVNGYQDREFATNFAWDSDLLAGYTPVFLTSTSEGGATTAETVTTDGLDEALRTASPDAALIVGYRPRFHRQAFGRARRAGLPILFRGETTDHAVGRGTLKAWIRDRALRWFYRRCDGLLYVGKQSYEHFLRLGCAEHKLFFSPYCVDTQVFRCDEADRTALRQVTRQRLGVLDSQRLLLFSGKLSPRKGPELLVRAVKELPTAIRQTVVIGYVGSGELREPVEALAREAPPVSAKFVGFQNQTQLSPYYHAADLLILPSLHSETWGLVVNEALHHGVPCVVSDAVGCAPDLIEPGATGELFRAGSVQDLGAALRRAMTLIGRSDVRQASREKVSGYTVDKAAEGIAEAYRSVARARRPGSGND